MIPCIKAPEGTDCFADHAPISETPSMFGITNAVALRQIEILDEQFRYQHKLNYCYLH